MLHFSCDLCGRQLCGSRFVAKLEVYPAFDPEELNEEDLELDNLEEISHAIDEMEASGNFELDDCGTSEFRFDFCPECRRRFLKDPLGRDALRRLNFSDN